MTKKTTIVAVILGMVMILGGGGGALAFAAPAVMNALPGVSAWLHNVPGMGGDRGRGVAGRVASVTNSGFTVTVPRINGSASKTVTVTVTSQTKVVFYPANTTGSMSDVTAGVAVRVSGRVDASGAVQAQTVMIEPAGDTAGGRVSAIDGTTITVTMGMGPRQPGQGNSGTANTTTIKIQTDASTKFIQPGGKAATLADVKVGSFVQAWGQTQADGSLLATQVVVRAAGQVPSAPDPRAIPPSNGQVRPFFVGRGAAGTVASVTGTGFTITVPGVNGSASKTVTVTVTSQTKVVLYPANTTGSMSDVTVGVTVRVSGHADASGVVQAQTVMIEPAGDTAGGRVTAVDGTTITVTMGMGWRPPGQGNSGTANTTTIKIQTDASTKFIQQGGRAATLADVKVGSFVQAWGQKQADGSLLATQVVVGGVFPGGPRPGRPANPQGTPTI
jgi:hypothetical protein